jgi:hypothetical protein
VADRDAEARAVLREAVDRVLLVLLSTTDPAAIAEAGVEFSRRLRPVAAPLAAAGAPGRELAEPMARLRAGIHLLVTGEVRAARAELMEVREALIRPRPP